MTLSTDDPASSRGHKPNPPTATVSGVTNVVRVLVQEHHLSTTL